VQLVGIQIYKENKLLSQTTEHNIKYSGLNWTGLDWTGLDWTELNWIELKWIERRTENSLEKECEDASNNFS